MRPFALWAAVVSVLLAAPARAELLIGLTVDGRLAQFDSASPGTISSVTGVTGLTNGDQLGSIDIRASDGLLYGLGINGSSARLYTLNPTTGAASVVSTLSANPGLALLAMDFNPVNDRLRVVTQFGTNLAVVPATGAATVQPNVFYPSGDPNFPSATAVTGVGYSNSFPGAASTTLYDIDLQRDALVTQNTATGALTTVGQLGLDGSFFAAFDISGASGTAYAALDTGGPGSGLYTVNLTTGAASLVGPVGGGLPLLIGLASPIGTAPTPPPVVPAPAGLVLAGVAATALGLRRRLV